MGDSELLRDLPSRYWGRHLNAESPVAVLVSGGMDSCAMLADSAERQTAHPIYVKTGMQWESAELVSLQRFLDAIASDNLQPLTVLEMPAAPLLGNHHWTMTPEDVPEYDAPDETVYIPGRNIVLISLAAIWCSLNDVNEVRIGTLAGNPFPDATPGFREQLARTCSMGLDHPLKVRAPLSELHKEELLARYGTRHPLHLTLTCSKPRLTGDDCAAVVTHCGECNKCRERHEAYCDAGLEDLTNYRVPVP